MSFLYSFAVRAGRETNNLRWFIIAELRVNFPLPTSTPTEYSLQIVPLLSTTRVYLFNELIGQ